MYIGAININSTYEALQEASYFKCFLLSGNLLGFWTKATYLSSLAANQRDPKETPTVSALYWGWGTADPTPGSYTHGSTPGAAQCRRLFIYKNKTLCEQSLLIFGFCCV